MNGYCITIPAFWHLRWTFWLLGHHVTMDNKSRDRTVSLEMVSFRPTCTKLLLVSNHTLSTTLSNEGIQLEIETLFKKKHSRLNLNLLRMCRMFKTFSPKKLVGTDKICECGVPSVSTHREVFVAVVNENLWVLRQWNCELESFVRFCFKRICDIKK